MFLVVVVVVVIVYALAPNIYFTHLALLSLSLSLADLLMHSANFPLYE